MTTSTSLRTCAAALLLLAGSASAQSTLFVETAGGPGEVRAYAADGSFDVVPGLEEVQLLPVELSGRVLLLELDRSMPRLRADVPGASRLALPMGQGSIYRYTSSAGAQAAFGWLRVLDGVPEVLLERAGSGPSASNDPFLSEVAYAPGALLIATLPAAGGELFEIDLATGTVEQRGAGQGPIAVTSNGLRLFDTWGVAAGTEGLYRFDRVAGSGATLVTGPTPSATLARWPCRVLERKLGRERGPRRSGDSTGSTSPRQADRWSPASQPRMHSWARDLPAYRPDPSSLSATTARCVPGPRQTA